MQWLRTLRRLWRDAAGAQPPSDAERAYARAKEMVSDGLYERAAHLLEGALASHSSYVPALKLAGWLAWKTGDAAKSLNYYDAALRLSPGAPELLAGRASALHSARRFSEAAAAARLAVRLAPEYGLGWRALGAALERTGDDHEAQACFHEAARLSPELRAFAQIRFDDEFWAALRTPALCCSMPDRPGAAPRNDHRHVVFSSCDGSYLRRFGSAFVHSFRQNVGPHSLLHLHIVNASKDDASWVETLAGSPLAGRLQITVEDAPQADRVYFSCARFLRLPHLLEMHERPILQVDIDSVFEADVVDVVEKSAGYDMALFWRPTPANPALDLSANFMVINPTLKSRRFFALVEQYVTYFLREGTAAWTLDQIALYCCYRRERQSGEAPSARVLDAADRACVHQILHYEARRLSDARFLRYDGDARTS